MEYNIETKTIAVKVFMDMQGKPCCSANAATRDVCQFYRTRMFGKYETCAAVPTEHDTLHRDGDAALGVLRPHKLCPIWNPTAAKP